MYVCVYVCMYASSAYLSLHHVYPHSVQREKDLVLRKYKETKSQMENDTDKEVEQLRSKYESRLHVERDATLRLKGNYACSWLYSFE